MTKHPSHSTRSSDASTHDEVCVNCGATDVVPGGWGKLTDPCPNALPKSEDDQYVATVVLYRRPDGGFRVKSPDLPCFVLSGLDACEISQEIIPAVLSLSMKKNRKET